MASPYHRILSKCDRALVAYLISKGAGTADDVFPAKRSQDKNTLPLTICWSERYRVIRNTGAYTVTASIMVKSLGVLDPNEDPGQPPADSDARIAAVGDALWTIDDAEEGDPFDSKKLAAQVTAAATAAAAADPDHKADLADFTALDVRFVGGEAAFQEGSDAWVETFELEIDCIPSALDE